MAIAVCFLLPRIASADTILYQDSFTRTGALEGSAPDVVDINGNLWQQQQAGQVYLTDGSAATNSGVYGSIYLPVNGSSGAILDGTLDFTLSVTISQGGTTDMGIALNTATYAGGDQYKGDFGNGAILTGVCLNDGGTFLSVYNGAYNGSAFAGYADFTPVTLSISYNATLGTFSYAYNNTVFATQTGVTAGQIAALNYVSIDNGSYNTNPGTFDDFKLSIATVPEPAPWVLLGLAGVGLLVFRRRKAASV